MPFKLLPALVLTGVVSAQRVQSEWGQCAGSKYAGPTACPRDHYCNYGNPWYSQCVPGTPDGGVSAQGVGNQNGGGNSNNNGNGNGGFNGGVPDTPIQTGGPPSPFFTTVVTSLTNLVPSRTQTGRYPTIVVGGRTTTLVPDPVYTGQDTDGKPPAPTNAKRAATPTTLAKNQYWIRAVEAPNFHKYLQTNPANSAGAAILASSKTAGQFNIVDGQLVESTGDVPLYMNVEKPTDMTQRTLATSFSTTKNSFGTFVFQGDAVTWSTPEIKRQNLAAWLVCKGNALFINTGAYNYQTPSGCADETIHFYNGATAND